MSKSLRLTLIYLFFCANSSLSTLYCFSQAMWSSSSANLLYISMNGWFKSPNVFSRCIGSICKQQRMKPFSSGDILGNCSKSGGGYFFIISFKIIGLSVDGYGFLPVTISNTIIPKAHISLGNE